MHLKTHLALTRDTLLILTLLLFCVHQQGVQVQAAQPAAITIVTATDASALEVLAAREVQRYFYLRTGHLLEITTSAGPLPKNSRIIAVGQKDRLILTALTGDPGFRSILAGLGPESYWLKTFEPGGRQVLMVAGGDSVGTLYAAYRLAEHLGVRFYLHGDELPSGRLRLNLPALDELEKPLFKLRGIQPFHDFPEGPDWWNTDDYLAIISQLPKLRMNFIGLHTYPEGGPNAEPTVWIGLPGEAGANGEVQASYPSSYQNTLRGNWGYEAKKTSQFAFGASQLFDRDDYGAEVMREACPQPANAEASNQVFNRTAAMLRLAFRQAHALGVKTCVGTETALAIPVEVKERLKAQSKDPQSKAVLEELYEGIFQRAAKAYDLDYYWFWTPEGWTWEGTKDEQVKRTIDDLLTAIGAAKNISAPFQLATCGWVLGPAQDRAMFDKVLPKDVAVSCINREVGKTPVDKGFADVQGRGKWAIPWMEDDPALTSPQLWVGRMRRDAADALRYGCDGLMGIHWRTRILGPNVSALAQAAWNQSQWNRPSGDPQQVFAPTEDFYRDWAEHQFGQEIAAEAAAIFAHVDCKLPRPSDWVNGPGGLKPDPRPWDKVQLDYAFVDELAALGKKVKSDDRPRFEYWAETFAYMKAMAHVDCLWAEYNQVIEKVKGEKDPVARKHLARQLALPARQRLVTATGEVYQHLLATVSTTGELGTVANWDQHIVPDLLTRPGQELSRLLSEPLPSEALLPLTYRGPIRLVVPTVRSCVATGEALTVKVILLADKAPHQAMIEWRPLGSGKFNRLPLNHVARGVYSVRIPADAAQGTGYEYRVKVTSGDGKTLYFPGSAPSLNQTVVVAPR